MLVRAPERQIDNCVANLAIFFHISNFSGKKIRAPGKKGVIGRRSSLLPGPPLKGREKRMRFAEAQSRNKKATARFSASKSSKRLQKGSARRAAVAGAFEWQRLTRLGAG